MFDWEEKKYTNLIVCAIMSCIDGSHNMFDATEKKPNNGITKIDFHCSAMTQHINARYERVSDPLFVYVLFGFGLKDRNSACAIS